MPIIRVKDIKTIDERETPKNKTKNKKSNKKNKGDGSYSVMVRGK